MYDKILNLSLIEITLLAFAFGVILRFVYLVALFFIREVRDITDIGSDNDNYFND